MTRVQRFAHGAELAFQPGSLGAGDAECGRGSARVEAIQSGRRRCCSESAQRAGVVPAFCIVAGSGVAAENALDVHTCAERIDQLRATGVEMFSQRQHGWRHRYRGMTTHRVVDIVVIMSVSG